MSATRVSLRKRSPLSVGGVEVTKPNISKSLIGNARTLHQKAIALSFSKAMGILAIRADERVKDVRFTEETISVDLMDGQMITVPLVWYPRLLNATPEQRDRSGK